MIRLQDNFNFRTFFLFLMLSIFSVPAVISQEKIEKDYLKKYYSVADGLSQSEVTSIVQDKYGFIWLGTRGGMNRFDGYDFLQFKPQTGEQTGLSNPSIETLFSDKEGHVWIGTKSGGVGLYNTLYNKFVEKDSLFSQLPNRIIAFYEDRDGNYWIGTWDDGVFKYAPEEGILKRYIENTRVSSIIQTQDGTIWFGSRSGLRYKKYGGDEILNLNFVPGYFEVTEMVETPEDSCLWMVGWNVGLQKFNYNTFEHVEFDFAGRDTQKLNCYSIEKDNKGRLWVGTWGSGLYCRENEAAEFEKVLPVGKGIGVMDRELDVILDIFEDNSGDIWVGTDGGGVVKFSFDRKFNTLFSNHPSGIGPLHINSLETNTGGQLWIGTRSNGLYVTEDKVSFDFVGFSEESGFSASKNFMVKSLYRDEDGLIWVGAESMLYIVSKNTLGEYELINSPSYFQNPGLKKIRKVSDVKKKGDSLFIATQQDGLYWFDRKSGKYVLKKRFYLGNSNLQDNRVSKLKFDFDGNLWIGTYKGLYLLGKEDSDIVNVHKFLEGEQRFLCDIILSCEVDSLNRIWVGTPCSLNSLTPGDSGNYILKEYTHKQGLTDDYINAIKPSGKFIWVSTNAGISRLDPESEVFRNYDVSDGVGGYNFAESSCAIDDKGIIYFGGYSDLTFFDPSSIEENKVKPSVVITDFRVMNQPVPVSEDGILPVSINEAENITLNYRQKEFSFEIAALDYKSPENNQFAYRLMDENGNGDWVYIGQRRHISFNNLKSGDYTLQLAGSNSNGVWNRDGRSLEITILPPPWETWYAFVIYLLVLLGIVTMINRVSLRQERLKNLARIEHVNRMQEHELNEYKLSFFTDISHELKTPLTLIQGPVEELRKKELASMSPAFFQKRVQLIHNSVGKLLDLLNQLLEFRKVEVGHARLSASKSDFAAFVASSCRAWEDSANNRGIKFSCRLKMKTAILWFDSAKLEIILNNLLSNAFKYCGEPGEVNIKLSDTEDEVILSVSNNGKNIEEKDIEKLFDRFYQASEYKRQKGYGIGLFLVKKIVELHKGSVEVESSPGEMTTFTVKLPKGDKHLSTDQKVESSGIELREDERSVLVEPVKEVKPRLSKTVKGTRVLVVEDNPEVQNYICSLLEDHFDVVTAGDGLEGYDAVIEFAPELVISDVMMPKSDGYELCSRIKKNENTAHIPVILLTAKDKADDHLMGTRKGADAYLTKPFDPVLLLEKVNQLITSRTFLAGKYKRKLTLDPVNKEITSDDEKMIKCVIQIIEKNAHNPELDSDFVAKEMGMSISTFYRRMKKTVDQTPGEFIKTTRLKLAGRYLKETNLTVSEIVEKIGYSDIRNFRKSFKNEFQVSPTDYRKNNE
ncbi:hybrid sensor histidine kinase/response regulator transcription factor [Marinilabilia rubra]|nr:hybrid sensor histidine kinase/response regulator transcription factor [Marinilabilia rubra]